jgi:hypothetical protein
MTTVTDDLDAFGSASGRGTNLQNISLVGGTGVAMFDTCLEFAMMFRVIKHK